MTYKVDKTKKHAKRDNNGNLMIKIHLDHKSHTAIFDCAETEHVGNQDNKQVTYEADDSCTLGFTTHGIFTVEPLQLLKNTPSPDNVIAPTGETSYTVTVPPVAQVSQLTPQPKVPPRLVVP